MSCLRLSPDEFFDLTPRAFQLAMQAHNLQQEQQGKLSMEAARLSGFLAAKSMWPVEVQKQYWCPQLYYKFPWDEEVKQPAKLGPTEKHISKAQKLLKKWPKPIEGR